jgi:hypothetical protein
MDHSQWSTHGALLDFFIFSLIILFAGKRFGDEREADANVCDNSQSVRTNGPVSLEWIPNSPKEQVLIETTGMEM